MADRVRWGVLGTASIARRRFLPALARSSKSEAVAIGSRNLNKAKEFASEFNIARPYGSYQQVIDDPEVEIVYVPLPNELHAEWVIKAADAGKHVLCEKPMALDGNEAIRMAGHCRDKGVILMEGFMYRLNPRTLLIKKMIDDGELGEVRTLIAQFGFTIDPSNTTRLNTSGGGGSLMDVGSYCINVSRLVMGDMPEWTQASQRLHPGLGCDLSTSAMLGFSEERTAMVSCSFESPFRSSVEIVGSDGILRADRFFTPQNEGKLSFSVTANNETRVFETDAVDQFLVETDHLADCVRGRASVLLDPHADAVPNALTIDSVRLAARTGCRQPASPRR